MYKTLLIFIYLTLSAFSFAESTGDFTPPNKVGASEKRCKFANECGWFFGFIDKKKEKAEEKVTKSELAPPSAVPKKEEEKDPCADRESWTVDCGFKDPGDDYDYMVIQRDALMKNSLMRNYDQKAVKGFQQYMLWLADAALTYSKTWEYNQIQDQSLNPLAKHPVSVFGLRAALKGKRAHNDSVIDEIIEQGGELVFFTRSDCTYCVTQKDVVNSLSKQTKLPVTNVSLDEDCMEGYEGDKCITASTKILNAAQGLGVGIVPDLYLVLPDSGPDGKRGWIRVSTGMESVNSIKRRIRMFFEGVRTASAKGLRKAANEFKDSQRPNVSFDSKVQTNSLPGTTFIKPNPEGEK